MTSETDGRVPAFRLGALVLLIALAGCSSNAPLERYEARGTVTPGSASPAAGPAAGAIGTPGNPPFYEVYGRRYHVMPTADGYRERGVASWYGPKFHGKRTSGGETYDMHGMTAAHKTLPIPTWVEVTNLDNGRQVIVRVNDRGPFVDDRIIDLSFRAATELDMIGKGTARVQVRALGAPAGSSRDSGPVMAEARTAPARESGGGFSLISTANAAPATHAGELYVQVGAFSDRENALGMVSRLKRSGFENTFVLAGGNDALYRVRIGPLADAGQFDSVRSELLTLGVGESRLVTNEM